MGCQAIVLILVCICCAIYRKAKEAKQGEVTGSDAESKADVESKEAKRGESESDGGSSPEKNKSLDAYAESPASRNNLEAEVAFRDD